MLCEGKTHEAVYLACKVALSSNNMTSQGRSKQPETGQDVNTVKPHPLIN